MTVRVRPEDPADAPAVQAIIGDAFPEVDGVVIEVGLNDELRRDPDRTPSCAWSPSERLLWSAR